MKLSILGATSVLFFVSCSVEKVNLSPTTQTLSNISISTPENVFKEIKKDANFIKYSSEITNSFSSVTYFSTKEVNKEIYELKFFISEYIYATQEHNTIGKENAFYNYEKSYKKLQKFKNKLPVEEQEILNRFLVNIKTNISLISSIN